MADEPKKETPKGTDTPWDRPGQAAQDPSLPTPTKKDKGTE